MLRITLAFVAVAFVTTPTLAAPCKDAKGQFMKCPTHAVHNVIKGKDGKCRVAAGPSKGKFTKCP